MHRGDTLTAEQLQELLSPKEYQLLPYIKQGKKNKEIAESVGTTESTVKVLKNRIKKKMGQKFVNLFDNKKAQGAELNQNRINKEDLPNILSKTEWNVFLELEKSNKNSQLIAKNINTTDGFVRIAIKRIKEKLGPDFHRFFSKQLPDGQEIINDCRCCMYLIHNIHNNGTRTIQCEIKGTLTRSSSKTYTCNWFTNRKNKRFQEKDFLEERLADKGFLRMAYDRYAIENDPPNTEEKLQLAINKLGHMDVLLTKRARHFSVIANSARYAVIPLTTYDLNKYSYKETYIDDNGEKKKRTRYPVKELLDWFRLKPTNVDQEIDANGKKYSVSHYVIKNRFHYRILTTQLIGNVNIYLPEQGTIAIEFERKIHIQSIYCQKKGEHGKDKLALDIQNVPLQNHTAEFNYGPGDYILHITIGDFRFGTSLKYEITIDKDNQVSNPKIKF